MAAASGPISTSLGVASLPGPAVQEPGLNYSTPEQAGPMWLMHEVTWSLNRFGGGGTQFS